MSSHANFAWRMLEWWQKHPTENFLIADKVVSVSIFHVYNQKKIIEQVSQ